MKLIVVGARAKHIAEWASTRQIPLNMLIRVTGEHGLRGAPTGTPHVLLDNWQADLAADEAAQLVLTLHAIESHNIGASLDWIIQWLHHHPDWGKRR